jgi:hypothetical protein
LWARSFSRITPAAHDDVPPPLVQLDDLELVGVSEQLVDVGDPAERDLAAGQEGIHAHQVHHDAALDLLDQGALDRLIGLVRHADLLPDPHEVGLLLREDDRAFLVLEVLEEDLDLVPFLGELLELVERNGSLGLEADVEDDGVLGDAEDLRFDDLALGDLRHGALVHREHLLVVLFRVFLVIEVGTDPESGGRGDLGWGCASSGVSRGHSGFLFYTTAPTRPQG